MKVVLITNIPTPYRNPVYERIFRKLRQNFLVIFLAKKEPNRKWKINKENFKFNHIFLKEKIIEKKDGFNYFHNNLDIIKILFKFNPDIIIITGFNPSHLYAWLYCILKKKKYIIMIDGTIHTEKKLTFIHKILRKIIFKKASAFISPGMQTKQLYKLYKVEEKKIFISNLAVNNSVFKNNVSIKEKEYDLLFVGNLINIKNPFFFLSIIQNFQKNNNKIRGLIVGEGYLRPQLENEIKKNNLDVKILGYVQPDKINEIYKKCKILLFPSKHDAWGLVINEALASGLPVISTPYVGAANDLLIHNVNGYILDLEVKKWVKSIENLLKDETIWNRFSKNATESVKKYNFDLAAEGILNACYFSFKE